MSTTHNTKMKPILTLLFSIVTTFSFCQPGPLHQNLNKITDEGVIVADIIVIDSTSDVSKVSKLKNAKKLWLKISNLKEIPKEFVKFVNTTQLTIEFFNVNCTDLSFLNEFPNLKTLSIDRFDGEVFSKKELKLDSLTSLRIGYCENLIDISTINKLNALEELEISNVANLKAFPKFGKQNSIKILTIDHMSNGRFFDEKNPKNFNTDIQNIKYLVKLEELTLGSLTFMHEIPDFLPASLKKLEINAWALHHWEGDKVEINNIDNLKLYPNLKELKLYDIYLKEINSDLKNLSLDYLLLWQIHDLTDIAWVFSIGAIKELKISDCANLTSIAGTVCENKIGKIEIERCQRIENIDFLFTCQNLNRLELYSQTNTLKISNSINMDNIPNIYISNSSRTIELYKKENVWQKQIITE